MYTLRVPANILILISYLITIERVDIFHNHENNCLRERLQTGDLEVGVGIIANQHT